MSSNNSIPLSFGKSPDPKKDPAGWNAYVQGVNQAAKSGFTTGKSWGSTQSKGGKRRRSRKVRKSRRRYR